MASNDTAALVVALSAQVSKFEKDLQGAVAVANKKTTEIENRFAAMNTAISGKLSQLGAAASANLGFAGTLLNTLGPAGIAAAVGIGAAVGAVYALANATEEYARKAKLLKEGAETAGLTITQFKLLGSAGKTVGLDFEETAGFFTKFIANLEALRNGGGPLYDALLKIDTGLLRQLSVTKDSAAAIDILVAAYKRLSDQTQRLDLAKAAGGRAGLSGGRLLDTLGNQGGLSGLEANSPKIDEGQITRAAQLKTEIDAIAAKTGNIWGGMFSDAILTNQRNARQEILQISQWIDEIVRGKRELKALDGDAEGGPLRITVNPAAKPGAPPPGGPGSPSIELAILQRNLALLGDGVTQGEQFKLKQLEIAAAQEKGALMTGIATRALEAFKLTMQASALATRERLALATEDQIAQVRLAQLSQDRAKYGLTENEVQRATVVILREAKEAADALTVRRAYLPGLVQASIDAQNLRKQVDTLATSSIDHLADTLVAVANGSETAGEAFKKLGITVLAELEKMIIKLLIYKAIQAASLGFAEGGAVGPGSGIPGFAGGGMIFGPGNGTSDSIIARLSDGEFVVNAQAAQSHRALLEAINNKSLPKFAAGGPVNAAQLTQSSGGGSALTVHVSLDNDMLRAVVQDESGRIVATATPQIVGQGIKQYDAALPGRLKDINRRMN